MSNFKSLVSGVGNLNQTTKYYDDWSENYDATLKLWNCLLYTSPSPRDRTRSRMPSSA